MTDIDILDENGDKTGQVMSMHDAHLQGLWHLSAWVWAYDSRGRILMQKGSAEIFTFPNTWTGSAAGHVDSGETGIEAALRELKEEIGVDAKLSELELVSERTVVLPTDGWKFPHRGFSEDYILEIESDRVGVLQESEVSEVKWFEIGELKEKLTNEYDQFVPLGDHYFKIIKLIEDRLELEA